MTFISVGVALAACIALVFIQPTASLSNRFNLAGKLSTQTHTRCQPTTLLHLANEINEVERVLPRNIVGELRKVTLLALVSASIIMTPTVALGDEIGREIEAPTLFTGESTQICVKRGPLGACTKTEKRTPENDNDKAAAYFKINEQKSSGVVAKSDDVEEGSELLKRLRQKTDENREKNEQAVKIKTFENNQAGYFGPFDRQTVILNTDGKTFTLLQNPQAMRLKKAGYIEGRKFVKQPSKQVIEDALEAEDGPLDIIKGLFSGGN